ncbi:hypothetical protein BKA62DRAFT_705270 [Auriculariales sp. MPI-PUGE-AT-0066]|nr:hypothetical protein BKA62DRAFT_705270 [Auriculariales sp. MPI-PUGE-AT-0066]
MTKVLGVAGEVTCSIYPVLDSTLISANVQEFLNLISQVHSHRIDYLKQLDSCLVSRVSHYRLDAQGHEVVVLHMVYSSAGNSSNARYFRLERFRDDPPNRESLACSIDLATSPSRTIERLDTVFVSDALQGGAYELLSPKYQIVREFDIPPGTLTILEALVIAQTLSDLSNRYTLFVHMCQFWAVNLFLIIKAVVNSRNLQQVTLTDGPAINTAGTFRGLRLVEVNTGRATADFLRCDDKSLRALCKSKSTVEFEAIKKVWSQASSLELGGPLTSAHPARNGTASDDDISTNAVYHTAQMNLDAWKVKIRAEISRMGSVS